MRHDSKLSSIFLMGLLAAGCGKKDGTQTGMDASITDAGVVDAASDAPADAGLYRAECDNLNPNGCMLPWPSSRYLVADSSTRTGRKVSIPAAAMPADMYGTAVSPDALNRWDGFASFSTFLTAYSGEVDPSNLVDWHHVAQSTQPSSPTVLLDVTTGQLVEHFAELDMHTEIHANLRPFYIRPAKRLTDNHHYVVAIRNLHFMDGSPVAPSAYFKALRDNTTLPEAADLEARRASFESNVFAPLTTAGIDRTTLVEAWDMWTASGQMAWGDLVTMRDDALTRLGDRGLGCTLVSVDEPSVSDDSNTFRHIEGTFTMPLYTNVDMPGSPLHRDSSGAPIANGTTEVPFTVVIPRSVAAAAMAAGGDTDAGAPDGGTTTFTPTRMVEYGHGLFGLRDEVTNGYMSTFLNRFAMVGAATDWAGMSQNDVGFALQTLSNFSNAQTFIERQEQGILNFIGLQRSLKGVCSDLPAMQINGMRVYDPSQIFYHGNSQGGIFGATLASLSVDVNHFALGVGAASYQTFMPRSVDWVMYEIGLKAWYRSYMDRAMLLTQLGQIWEQTDPAGFADHILQNEFPNTPTDKQVLFQIGRYDGQVANVGSDLAARTMGLPLYTPSVYAVDGLTTFTDTSPSGYVIYDEGAPAIVSEQMAYPPMDTVTHEAVRRDPRAQQQLNAFMHTDGVVQNFCDSDAGCVALDGGM